ncbi:PEP-CTERM sorting domain-containing protein [Microseira wollei]|uniref:Ice-binding protein C-terminal domain-containing protein n=1 Tax=Microseira wollei NIES-4236 TaxID=2530354 RepID=A0AAV3X5R0_9CYAN|nr:PEP-CTERM sorting domain-containing protein [Microseira wollei]GET37145.1 hypothetical protein Mfla_1203 [Microseira wollei NIES-4236]
MNFKQASAFIGLLATSTIALSTAPAQAFNFASGNLSGCATGGTSCTTNDGFTITATGGTLESKTVNGVTGVGVGNQTVVAEINAGESIDLLLPGGSGILASLDLGFMYQPGVFSDQVLEKAIVTTNTGLMGYLTVQNDTKALWEVAGLGISQTLTALSSSTQSGGGLYSILNPFGNNVVSSVRLEPSVYNSVATDYRNSDFSLMGAQAERAVPEPTTLAGLGIVAGLLAASRRRKANAAS